MRLTVIPQRANLSPHSRSFSNNFVNPCIQSEIFAGVTQNDVLLEGKPLLLNTDFSLLPGTLSSEVEITNILEDPALTYFEEALEFEVLKNQTVRIGSIGKINPKFEVTDQPCVEGSNNNDPFQYFFTTGGVEVLADSDKTVSLTLMVARKVSSIGLRGSPLKVFNTSSETTLQNNEAREDFKLTWIEPRIQDVVGFELDKRSDVSAQVTLASRCPSAPSKIALATSMGLMISNDGGVNFSTTSYSCSGTNIRAMDWTNDCSALAIAGDNGICVSYNGSAFSLVSGTSTPPPSTYSFKSVSIEGVATKCLVAIDTQNKIWHGCDTNTIALTRNTTTGIGPSAASFDQVYLDFDMLLYVAANNGIHIATSPLGGSLPSSGNFNLYLNTGTAPFINKIQVGNMGNAKFIFLATNYGVYSSPLCASGTPACAGGVAFNKYDLGLPAGSTNVIDVAWSFSLPDFLFAVTPGGAWIARVKGTAPHYIESAFEQIPSDLDQDIYTGIIPNGSEVLPYGLAGLAEWRTLPPIANLGLTIPLDDPITNDIYPIYFPLVEFGTASINLYPGPRPEPQNPAPQLFSAYSIPHFNVLEFSYYTGSGRYCTKTLSAEDENSSVHRIFYPDEIATKNGVGTLHVTHLNWNCSP